MIQLNLTEEQYHTLYRALHRAEKSFKEISEEMPSRAQKLYLDRSESTYKLLVAIKNQRALQ